MNIIVCLKQVPDTEGVIEIDQRTNSVKGLKDVVNPRDMLAVEEAVRIKESEGAGQVTLLCMGPSSASEALRNGLSIGADRAVLLWDSAFSNSDSYATGLILAKAISSFEYNLILCGQKAADTEAGQVGAVIAEMLHIPLVSRVIKVEVSSAHNKVTAHRRLERGDAEVVETVLPAVLTVETGLNMPRYAAARSILTAKKKPIEEYDLGRLGLSARDVGINGSRVKVVGVALPKAMAKTLVAPDSSLPAWERLKTIMSGGITEKKGDMLEGAPRELASKVLQFLTQQKVVSNSPESHR